MHWRPGGRRGLEQGNWGNSRRKGTRMISGLLQDLQQSLGLLISPWLSVPNTPAASGLTTTTRPSWAGRHLSPGEVTSARQQSMGTGSPRACDPRRGKDMGPALPCPASLLPHPA